uniref:C-type lectin domain-containing protein n=1 Tax=Erpetoichthys calabaricus TaxID=27687 RepID=A0A8C4RU25_ERPCA
SFNTNLQSCDLSNINSSLTVTNASSLKLLGKHEKWCQNLCLCSTWEDALDYCRERNSDLISISSQMEQDAIAALVNTTNSPNVWLGLRRSRMFGFWFWIDEKPLSYEQWVNGSSSQLPACKRCAVMSQANNFSWIDVSCSEEHTFICRNK